MSPKITLILADDHEMVRKGLTAFLATAKDIEILAVAECGFDAIEAAKKYKPMVALIDLFMPNLSAIETVKQIKNSSPNTNIIMVTSYEGDEYLIQITKAGATSYILKDTTPEELILAVRRAAIGESTISPRIAKSMFKIAKLTQNTKPKKNNIRDKLTEREIEVLQCIAEGLANLEIAHKLKISEKTVKSHVSNILGKLYLNDRTQAAIYAWREKIVFEDAPKPN